MSDEITTNLPLPAPDQAYIDVSALEAGNISGSINLFLADTAPEIITSPSLAFSLRHSKSGTQLVFDLGARRDFEGYPPPLQQFAKSFGLSFTIEQDVAESLLNGGVSPDKVDVVIISHLHWDHIGDHTPFTKATFIVGEGCRQHLENGYPGNPDAITSSTAVPVERARFISKSEMNDPIGPFPHALDFFGDGSLYIIDAPGHYAGHINVLARTSADGSWILLGGDSVHDWRLVTGEKTFAFMKDEATGHMRCIAHEDKDAAEENLRRIRALLQVPRVQLVIAHDARWYNANKGGSAFLPGVIPPLVS